ncbi:MAG TPA: hypothetical protein PK173_05105, partial [Dokdonella sp.]|nr:hypothetical protein [Dokdonella sp.]
YDGSILEISTDSAATFTQVAGAALLTQPYKGPISSSFQNPLSGLQGWCGDPVAYFRSVVDLTAYAGQTVQFRFRLGSDSSVGRTPHGWYIDDVTVQSCIAGGNDIIFQDGFDPPSQ